MREEYQLIDGLDGYEISNCGNIRNERGKVLSPFLTKNGYKKINLMHKGYYIHRLVATAFIPNSAGKPQVNHKNGDKTDNRAINLEWVNNSENVLHSRRLSGVNSTGKPIPVLEEKSGKKFGSIADAAKAFNLNVDTVRKSIRESRHVSSGERFIRL